MKFSEYCKMVDINEMARRMSEISFSRLESNPDYRKQYYDFSKDVAEVTPSFDLPDNIKVHKKSTDKFTNYFTNDHSSGTTLHLASINHNKASATFPLDHDEQTTVDRVKNSVLPKGYAENFIYDHFKKSDKPLKSSEEQYTKGHELWRRMAARALNDGFHVYHYDGSKFHKTTPETLDDHLNRSFGKEDEFLNRHMILSKKELNV